MTKLLNITKAQQSTTKPKLNRVLLVPFSPS